MQPTALVHETYLRLADSSQPEWQPWVVREARAARAWLYDRMTDGDGRGLS